MSVFLSRLWARMLSTLLIFSVAFVSLGSTANARFISPHTMDPTLPDVGTNRYAYSLNDPINRSDPTGHIAPAIAAVAGWCAGGGCAAIAAVAEALVGSAIGTAVGVSLMGGWRDEDYDYDLGPLGEKYDFDGKLKTPYDEINVGGIKDLPDAELHELHDRAEKSWEQRMTEQVFGRQDRETQKNHADWANQSEKLRNEAKKEIDKREREAWEAELKDRKNDEKKDNQDRNGGNNDRNDDSEKSKNSKNP